MAPPLSLPCPLRLAFFIVLASSLVFATSTADTKSTKQFQQYLVCKDPKIKFCSMWLMEVQEAVALKRKSSSVADIIQYCGLASINNVMALRNYITIARFSDNKFYNVHCEHIKLVEIESKNWELLTQPTKDRVRRQAGYSLRGRYRGQTQSQYLAIDKGSGKDDGKAEAHSAADSSRASVSGSSGMGQAQSQTMYDPSCDDDCVDQSEIAAENLKRHPLDGNHRGAPNAVSNGGSGIPSGSNGYSSSKPGFYGQNLGPVSNTQFGPGQIRRPDENINGNFGNKQHGLPDINGIFTPNKGLGNLPARSEKGVFSSPNNHISGPYHGTSPGESGYGINQGSPSITGTYNPYNNVPPQNGNFNSNEGSGPSLGTNNPSEGDKPISNGFATGPVSSSQGTFNPNLSGLPKTDKFGQSSSPGGPIHDSSAFGPSQQNLGTPGLPNYGTYNGNVPVGSSLGFNHQGVPNSGNSVPYFRGTPGGNIIYGTNHHSVPSDVEKTHLASPGSINVGNFPQKQHGLPDSSRPFNSNPVSAPNGIGPYRSSTPDGNIQVGSNSPIQPGPYGLNTATGWPHGTGSFTAPDGTTYFCCVVGPNNNPQHYKINGGGPGTSLQANGPYGSGFVSEPQNLLAPGTSYGISQGNYGNQLPQGSSGGLEFPNKQQNTQVPTNYAQGPQPFTPNSQYNPRNIGGQNDLGGPGTSYSPGSTDGRQNQGSINDQYHPVTGVQYRPLDTNGQFNPQGAGGLYGPGGQYIPGNKGNQYTPGSIGNQYGPLGQGGQYVPGGANNPNSLGSTGGQYVPGSANDPNSLGSTGGQFVPGSTGPHYSLDPTGGQYNPSGTGIQYSPGNIRGQFNPGGTNGQYVPEGIRGQYVPQGSGGLQNSQSPNIQYSSGSPNDQYVSNKPDGQNGLQGPKEQFGLNPMIGQNSPLNQNGQYSPGFIGQHGVLGPDGQFGHGTMGNGNGLKQGNQYAPGLTAGQPGFTVPGNTYSSGNTENGSPSGMINSYDGNNQRPGSIPTQNIASNGQYGQGQNPIFYPQQYGKGVQGTGSALGNGPYGFNNQASLGQKTDYAGVPQNVMEPNSEPGSIDGDDSEAEASVSQATNGTVATASSKGGNDKGRAQTHVHGAYTGSGSFSAQAEISGDNKAANSEVTGDKTGASSNAQGSGRNNKSQANVQLGSETGAVLTGSQSDGVMHSSNTQVQGSVKGGMADAQARGPGSTSSQAQIGFTPYKEGDKSHDLQRSPFIGGGTAAAQSSGRTGSSQSQLRGTFKYGITYNGAAQAGASLNKDTIFSNRLAFDKIDVYDKNNKNINVNSEKSLDTENKNSVSTEKVPDQESNNFPEKSFEMDKNTPLRNPTEVIPSTDIPFEIKTTTAVTNEVPKDIDPEYSDHNHADHHKTDSQPLTPTLVPPVESRRSFPSMYGTNSKDYEYSTDKDDNPAEDYDDVDVDDGFAPEGNDAAEGEQGEYTNYNEFTRDSEATHQSLQNPKRKGIEVRQTTGGNTQHIILGSLSDQDAEITQKNSEQPDEGKVYQPGERVPGTGGYTIPIGFTGSVKSVASKGKTFVVGSKESPSQAQTVSLTPGSGKIKYTYPSTYTRNIHPKDLRSLYNPKSDDNNRYVSVSKSVTRDLDGENNIRKQYSHTYFTKSSSCGYFSFTCTMVSGAEGRKKVCRPKIPTNPDGSPMRC